MSSNVENNFNLPMEAPAGLTRGGAEVYARMREEFVELNCRTTDLPTVVIFCNAVAANEHAAAQYDKALDIEAVEPYRNGDVRATDYWQGVMRKTGEIIQKCNQHLGTAPSVRTRLKQELESRAKKSGAEDDWGFLDVQVKPAVVDLCKG